MPNQIISSVTGFQGVWIDALVPLKEDLSIDLVHFAAHLRNLSANGIEKFVLFGQAGEGFTFTVDEKLAAVGHLLTAGFTAENLLLGIQSSSFVDIAQLVGKARGKGVKRFLISPPQYGYPLTNEALFEYFDQLIKHVNRGDWQLFIHQLGGANHATDLSESLLADLKKAHPQVFVGIVDQDVHINHTFDLIRSFGTQLTIASCYEPNLTILRPPVCVSALANIIPGTVKHMLANDVVNNATKIAGMKVVKPEDRALELLAIIANYPLIATLKLMLSQHYRMDEWERVRPPQALLHKDTREKLKVAFKRFDLQGHE